MIALFALAVAPVPSADDIVVIARKMQFIEVDMKAPRRKGLLVLDRCKVTRGSGNAELDAVPCAVAQDCMATVPASRKLLQQCVEQQSQLRLDAIIARWRAVREAAR